jgi:hypothetical protein
VEAELSTRGFCRVSQPVRRTGTQQIEADLSEPHDYGPRTLRLDRATSPAWLGRRCVSSHARLPKALKAAAKPSSDEARGDVMGHSWSQLKSNTRGGVCGVPFAGAPEKPQSLFPPSSLGLTAHQIRKRRPVSFAGDHTLATLWRYSSANENSGFDNVRG